MTKSTLFAAIVTTLTFSACQKPAELDKLKTQWDTEVKVLAAETKHLARWQLLLEKKRTEIATRGPSPLVDQAQGPLTQSGNELRSLLTDLDKKVGPEAEAKRKAGKSIDLIQYTDDTAWQMTEKLRQVRNDLEAADNLLAAAEQAPVRGPVAMPTTTPPVAEPTTETATPPPAN